MDSVLRLPGSCPHIAILPDNSLASLLTVAGSPCLPFLVCLMDSRLDGGRQVMQVCAFLYRQPKPVACTQCRHIVAVVCTCLWSGMKGCHLQRAKMGAGRMSGQHNLILCSQLWAWIIPGSQRLSWWFSVALWPTQF